MGAYIADLVRRYIIYTTPSQILEYMGREVRIGRFVAFTSADTPAPLKDWLDRELPDCSELTEVAKGVWERVNKMMKKDVDQYLFQLSGKVFTVFKNGKKVVEVKHD